MKTRVSVVLPVFNGEAFVEDAVESILTQSMRDFELLVINDGSTDNTQEIIARLALNDSRIRLINHSKNAGLIASLNEGLELAQAKYVARLDADDIAHPKRFELQLKLLEESQQVIVCGSYIRLFGNRNGVKKYPTTNEELKSSLLFFCPLAHPSVMFRKKAVEKIGYENGFEFAEDYRLWSRLINEGDFAMIPQPLLSYRTSESQISHTKRLLQQKNSLAVAQHLLEKLELEPSKNDLEFHEMAMFSKEITIDKLKNVHQWFLKISEANTICKLFQAESLNVILAKRFFRLCLHTQANKREAWDIWHQSFLGSYLAPTNRERLLILKQKYFQS
jgi:glycosyltransferase involved in cell wall biosynthesis